MKLHILASIFTLVFLGITENSQTAPIGSRTSEKETKEAIQIALESTGELIPQAKLVEKIKSDLALIRYLDKSLVKRTHTGRWTPGEIVIKGEITQKQLKDVENSEFKPVSSISSSISSEGGEELIIKFAKPYHPEKLATLLKLRFGFDSEPNRQGEKGDQILYRNDLSTYFWNSENGRNCAMGCLAQYSVSVNVDTEEDSLLNQNNPLSYNDLN